MSSSYSHKAGSLKQSNKKHKGKASKRAAARSFGPGKVAGGAKLPVNTSGPALNNNNNVANNARADRVNKQAQLRKNKQENVMMQRRLGSIRGPPKLVSVIALSDLADGPDCVSLFLREAQVCDDASFNASLKKGGAGGGGFSADDIAAAVAAGDSVMQGIEQQQPLDNFEKGVVHALFDNHKTRCSFQLHRDRRDIRAVVDAAKLCDIVIFVVDVKRGAAEDIVDETGRATIAALLALGCPEVLVCIMGLGNGAAKKSAYHVTRKAAVRILESHLLMSDVRFVDVGGAANCPIAVRTLCNMTTKNVSWKESRSFLVAHEVNFGSDSGATGAEMTSVTCSGWLRGKPLSVHSLVHLEGVGVGRVLRIAAGDDRKKPSTAATACGAGDHHRHHQQQVVSDPTRQESLTADVLPGGSDALLQGEQTWPQEFEMEGGGGMATTAADAGAVDREVGRNRRIAETGAATATGETAFAVPQGMSSYQADWYVDESGQADFGDDDDNEGGDDIDGEGLDEDAANAAATAQVHFNGLLPPTHSSSSALNGGLGNGSGAVTQKQLKEELMFPDEVDTPYETSVRERYARYRALQSFRSSPWHPKENLPLDYSRIYQFENFSGAQRLAMSNNKAVEKLQMVSVAAQGTNNSSHSSSSKNEDRGASLSDGRMEMQDDDDNHADEEYQEDGNAIDIGGGASVTRSAATPSASSSRSFLVPGTDEFVSSGQYVHIEIQISADKRTDLDFLRKQQGFVALYGLYPDENKISVLHFNIQRQASFTEPIKSKDPLLFQVGFRSFMTKPIFSESNLNCDKHKLERFLLNDHFSVASCYGPVSMSPNSPLLVYKHVACPFSTSGLRWQLIASGSLMSVDPDRIVLKKIILTGIPIRVRKKYAVVKHLFNEPMDVRWFKPAELVTKMGLRGHIKEPVGTHGLLKAYFSGPISQNDTVMLVLYKRVYPKFPTENLAIK